MEAKEMQKVEKSHDLKQLVHMALSQKFSDMDMLWFKFILGLMFFELVSVWFAIVPDYGNEYMTKENKN